MSRPGRARRANTAWTGQLRASSYGLTRKRPGDRPVRFSLLTPVLTAGSGRSSTLICEAALGASAGPSLQGRVGGLSCLREHDALDRGNIDKCGAAPDPYAVRQFEIAPSANRGYVAERWLP